MAHLKLIFLSFAIIFAINSLKSNIVLAANTPITGIGTLTVPAALSTTNPTGDISNYVGVLLNGAFAISLIALIAYIVLGGYQWIMAGGDKKALTGARATLTNAAIGIILLSVMFAVSRIFALFIGDGGASGTAATATPFSTCRGGGPSGARQCSETPTSGDVCPGQSYFYVPGGPGSVCPT